MLSKKRRLILIYLLTVILNKCSEKNYLNSTHLYSYLYGIGPPIHFISIADEDFTIFADGVKLTSAGQRQMHPVSISLPDITSLIAVEMRNVRSNSGFMGHFSNGQVTDTSWKCSRQWEKYWWSPSFNDSDWYSPHEIKDKAVSSFANVKEISSYAKWIGMKADNTSNKALYCRKLLSKIFFYKPH